MSGWAKMPLPSVSPTDARKFSRHRCQAQVVWMTNLVLRFLLEVAAFIAHAYSGGTVWSGL